MLMIAILAIASCVPKATDKKANCGENEAFNSVSRSCYSIQELRTKPVATTSKASLTEETPQTFILAYTDGNNDLGLKCEISATSSELEIINPAALNNGLSSKADEVNSLLTSLAANPAVSLPMNEALAKADASVYLPSKKYQLGEFIKYAKIILVVRSGSPGPELDIATKSLSELEVKLVDLNNRCECTGGVCSTTLIPKLNKTGIAGFSYTITDVDGTSDSRPVAVMISPDPLLAFGLRPVGQSDFYTLRESETSKVISYPGIKIPDGADVLRTPASSFVYKFKESAGFTRKKGPIPGTDLTGYYGETLKGIVYGCMDLYPSTNGKPTNEKECIYIPNSGDEYDHELDKALLPHPNAKVVMNDLTEFVAISTGTAGNKIKVQYLNIKQSYPNSQVYGLTNSSEAFIRVFGNDIKIFINPGVTTSQQISALVLDHLQASKLVTTITGGGIPAPSAVMSLQGGLAAFDEIPFTVNNLKADSTNDSAVTIRMTAINDAPMVPKDFVPMFSQEENFMEDTARSAPGTLRFKDVDSIPVLLPLPITFNVQVKVDTICEIGPQTPTEFDSLVSSGSFLIGLASDATAVNNSNIFESAISITPQNNFAGTACLYYMITDPSGDKSFIQSVKILVSPINDAPEIIITSINDVIQAPPILFDTLDPSDPLYTMAIVPMLILEREPTEDNSGSIIVEIGPGGYLDEKNQTLTLSVSSNKLNIFPEGSISIEELLSTGNRRLKITFKPEAYQSGVSVITLTVKDNGGVANGGVDTRVAKFEVTVTFVDNPPFFLSTITKIETNEGGAVQSDGFLVDEDKGSTEDEDYQAIRIVSITSDNQNVLRDDKIKIFYDVNDNGVEDSTEERCVPADGPCSDLLDTVDLTRPYTDVKKHKFYLKLDPIDGIAGNANIKMTITDGNPDPAHKVSTQFSLVVHPIAALHGGWNNISSVGIKTDKNKTPASPADIKCDYNKSTDLKNCGANNCTGTTSPNGNIIPTHANVIYWDSASLRCYRSDDANGINAFSWVDMNTSCPIKREAGICSGDNCIKAIVPIPEKIGQYLYNSTTKTCLLSTGTTIGDWIEYSPAKVTLEWKPFIMAGAGPDSDVTISGWNVYRREVGSDFNFKKGAHLKNSTSTEIHSIVGSGVRMFTDTTAIAGRVYYYIVRPVDNKRFFPTYTPEIFSEVRVIAAPTNYSFVHRWIVNQEICNGMHITTKTTPHKVDQIKNYQCEYKGPGSNGLGYYDYGRDLLVDTQEAGCAYGAAPKCTANGCVGIGNPTALGYPAGGVLENSAALGDMYYDRSTGACFISNGGSWSQFETAGVLSATTVNKTNSALNAPLTNITKGRAVDVCNGRILPQLSSTSSGTPLALPGTNVMLPNKKDYMGYAAQRIDKANHEISTMEEGNSLDIQSGCNSSLASGLETAYTDSAIPSTSFSYSIPGTYASGIRSLYTGSIPWARSEGTEACVSRFGIQDLYGNVAEWVDDGMTCDASPLKICSAKINLTNSFKANDYGVFSYKFDNVIGPYHYLGLNMMGDPVVNYLTQWIFSDQLYEANYFNYPLGMPLTGKTMEEPLLSTYYDWILPIGPAKGITDDQLHDDGIIVNGSVNASKTFAVGGSYLSRKRSGRFSSELIEDNTSNRPDVGFRCIVPINSNFVSDPNHKYQY